MKIHIVKAENGFMIREVNEYGPEDGKVWVYRTIEEFKAELQDIVDAVVSKQKGLERCDMSKRDR